jgi:predicted site-specific integrase-resolvase
VSTTLDPDGPPLTPAEVAELFGVDVKTVARWNKAGKLKCIWPPGVARRYERPVIIAALSGGKPAT